MKLNEARNWNTKKYISWLVTLKERTLNRKYGKFNRRNYVICMQHIRRHSTQAVCMMWHTCLKLLQILTTINKVFFLVRVSFFTLMAEQKALPTMLKKFFWVVPPHQLERPSMHAFDDDKVWNSSRKLLIPRLLCVGFQWSEKKSDAKTFEM